MCFGDFLGKRTLCNAYHKEHASAFLDTSHQSEIILSSSLLSVFRQRVLSKLFPSEEESDSEGDEDTTKQLHSPVGTESEDLHDVACKGQKRKLSEHDGSFLFLRTLLFRSSQ